MLLSYDAAKVRRLVVPCKKSVVDLHSLCGSVLVNEVYPSEGLHKSGLRFHKSRLRFHKSGLSFHKSGISFYKSGSCEGKSGNCAGFHLIHIRGIDVVPFTRAYLRV